MDKTNYAIRFVLTDTDKKYPQIQKADSPFHTLIAYEICRSVIYSHESEIYPWRFHRLFQDEHMNQLTFRFSSSEEICSNIMDDIGNNKTYKLLKDLGLLQLNEDGNLLCVAKGPDGEPKQWPKEINLVWPHFICGASKSWLEMIHLFCIYLSVGGTKAESFEDRIAFYNQINSKIDSMWVKWGGHAFNHHLNALFGYKYINVNFSMNSIKDMNFILAPIATDIGNIPMPGIKAKMRF